jgi:hypothetical protein
MVEKIQDTCNEKSKNAGEKRKNKIPFERKLHE